ncbi:MAG: ribosome maturation factor RimM [Lachnospirales bacterium]
MDFFEIGKIVNTQGIKGDVRVVPSTDDIKRFELLKNIKIYKENKIKELTIEKVWYHKKFVIIKFEEINNMTEAETLKDYVIRISDDEALPLEEDEYFIRDLIGIDVYASDEKIGIIKDVLVTGANDVYVVKTEGKDLLLPAIKECINNIDMNKKVMNVTIMKGLE